MTLEQVYHALTTLDPAWAISRIATAHGVVVNLSINGITRGHVGTMGENDAERYEDALRNAALMFGIGREVTA